MQTIWQDCKKSPEVVFLGLLRRRRPANEFGGKFGPTGSGAIIFISAVAETNVLIKLSFTANDSAGDDVRAEVHACKIVTKHLWEHPADAFFPKTFGIGTLSRLTDDLKNRINDLATNFSARKSMKKYCEKCNQGHGVFTFAIHEMMFGKSFDYFFKPDNKELELVDKYALCTQVVHALHVLGTLKITHNDLHMNNIMVIHSTDAREYVLFNNITVRSAYKIMIFDWDRAVFEKGTYMPRFTHGVHISRFVPNYDLLGFITMLRHDGEYENLLVKASIDPMLARLPDSFRRKKNYPANMCLTKSQYGLSDLGTQQFLYQTDKNGDLLPYPANCALTDDVEKWLIWAGDKVPTHQAVLRMFASLYQGQLRKKEKWSVFDSLRVKPVLENKSYMQPTVNYNTYKDNLEDGLADDEEPEPSLDVSFIMSALFIRLV
jgi:hypothetical protein